MRDSRAETAPLIEAATVDAVFEALGGLDAVAALTGSKYKAVSNWKSFGSFPARTILVMTRALRDRGYTAPSSLWNVIPAIEAAE